MNDVSVIRVSRCGITRGTLSGKHVFTLIWIIMNDSSFKIVSNWAVLTVTMHIFVLSLPSVPGDPMRALLMSKYTACIFSLKYCKSSNLVHLVSEETRQTFFT